MSEKMGSWAKLVAGAALFAGSELPVHAEEPEQKAPLATLDTTEPLSLKESAPHEEKPAPLTPEEIAKKIIQDAEARGYITRGELTGRLVIEKGGIMVGSSAPPLTEKQKIAIAPLLKFQRETCLMIPQGTIESMDAVAKKITIKTFTGQIINYEPEDQTLFRYFKLGEKIGYKILYRGSKSLPVEYICQLPFVIYTTPDGKTKSEAQFKKENQPAKAVAQTNVKIKGAQTPQAPDTQVYILLPQKTKAHTAQDDEMQSALWMLARIDNSDPTIPPLRLSDALIASKEPSKARRDPGTHKNKPLPPLRGPYDWKAKPGPKIKK